jgi:hypothetical protein
VGAAVAATGSTAAVTKLAARLIVPKPPESKVEPKGEQHAEDREP